MKDLKIKRDEIKKQKLEELIKFQDSCLRDKPSAEEYINMMPCWQLDEDHMILLRQKASQDMFPMFFDDGFDAGVEIMGKQIKLLKEALEFYAKAEGNCEEDREYQPTGFIAWKIGKHARKTLKKLEEMENEGKNETKNTN